jgi:hypothetical protein
MASAFGNKEHIMLKFFQHFSKHCSFSGPPDHQNIQIFFSVSSNRGFSSCSSHKDINPDDDNSSAWRNISKPSAFYALYSRRLNSYDFLVVQFVCLVSLQRHRCLLAFSPI